MKINLICGIITCLIISAVSCSDGKGNPQSPQTEQETSWNIKANDAQAELWRTYWNAGAYRFNSTELGSTTLNYWWQAHALDVLVDYGSRTDTQAVVSKISLLCNGINQANSGFINDYYDDMEWMALANVRAFHLTQNQKYLSTAHELWSNIIPGWNTTSAGGGICWQKLQTYYKNTPANAPAAILGARLYLIDNDTTYLNWSRKIYDWLTATLVDSTTGIVWDGINRNNDNKIDKLWLFTYNQGTYIGASVELYSITKDSRYLSNAKKTMEAVMNNMVTPGTNILKSEGGGDGGLFKGILVRYITELILIPELDASSRGKYIGFLTANANSLWNKARRSSQFIFNNDWALAPTNTNFDLSVQLSAVMMLEAMAKLENNHLL